MADGKFIVGDGSGGGGGASYLGYGGNGGAGGGGNDTLIGTAYNDVIFGDGSGGGGGQGGYGGYEGSGGAGGGGADLLYGGAGNDILFGDGFNGALGNGGFGGGGGGGAVYGSVWDRNGGLGGGDGGDSFGYDSTTTNSGAYSTGGLNAVNYGGGSKYGSATVLAGGGGGGFGDIGNGGDAGNLSDGGNGSAGGTSKYTLNDSGGTLYSTTLTEVTAGNIYDTTNGTTNGYGSGNDLLDGGAGSDHYFGMGGADTFVVSEQDNAGTDVDTIWDFSRTDGDKIQLEDASGNIVFGSQLNTLLAGADTTTSSGNTIFTMGDGSQLIVKGVTDLAASDFVNCFLSGTRFETADGMKAIEELQRGDLLKTADGYAPLKWLAHRQVDWSMSLPRRVAPVLVKQGALGHGLPLRDLYVSPAHAFEVDGLLVQAELLVNGESIVQLFDYDRDFTYYNIELDAHSIVCAEGAAVESYLEVGDNRRSYDNKAEFHALYPDHRPTKAMDKGRITLKRQLPTALGNRPLSERVRTA